MVVKFPASEFFEDSGNAAYKFQEDLRDGIVGFACNLWQNYPAFITQGTNPGSSFARGYMNQTCSPIQPPVPAPDVPFTGGQCFENYKVDVNFDFFPQFSSTPQNQTQNIASLLPGPITDITYVIIGDDDVIRSTITYANGSAQVIEDTSSGGIGSIVDGTITYLLERNDGEPDVCGNPDADYISPPPTDDDLRGNIIINNLDGTDNIYEIEYNKITNNYNFPFGFKVNGVNVTMDLGGLTVQGDLNITNFAGGQEVPPPGSDGGETGNGSQITKTYPKSEQVVIPDFSPVPQIEETLEHLVCNEGVIETVQKGVKVIGGQSLATEVLLDILDNIVQDVCGTDEAVVGLPEYYDLLPGIERPAIVFLWKEYINETWQARTYSSTVSNPSASAIANISTMIVPDKITGQYRKSLTLNTGGRIISTGNTELNRDANFTFLLNLVDSAALPVDFAQKIVESRSLQLQEVSLKCRKIEFYPNGKKDNVAAAVQRYIDA